MTTIDFEQIKNEWRALSMENAALKQKNIDLTRRLVSERVTNNQQKLARSYRIGYMGFAFPLLAYFGLYLIVKASIGLCVFYSLYGIILGCFDIWFMSFIKRADYSSISTVNALQHATKVVKYQNWATIGSIIGCIILCIPLFYEFSLKGNDGLIWGGIAGGIIGGVIGAKKCIKNHQLARRMVAELKTIEE
ncbi:MAG: hypothetical protein K2K94_02100 [Muribaculaceae bacterium]|nr:hypothetical protein [Muribaculaceae bacterium]